jgi:sec-independent protein translocase protein TatA
MSLAAVLGPLGVPELLIIAFIVLLVFGVGRLPEIGGAVGKSIKEFRKSTKDLDDDDQAQNLDTTTADAIAAGTATTVPPAPSAPVAADASADVRFCSECGAKNTTVAKFCEKCGHTMSVMAS